MKTGSALDEMSIFRGDSWNYSMPVCPITCGLPTRMTANGYLDMCGANQDICLTMRRDYPEKYSANKRSLFCIDTCRGKQPAELTIIKLEKRMETEAGVCAYCGRSANLQKNGGEMLCSPCANVSGSILNRPEAVWKLLEKRAPDYLSGKLKGEVFDDVLADKLAELQDVLAEMEKSAENMLETIKERNGLIGRLQDERDELLIQVEHVMGSNPSNRDSVLLDIAMNVMAGTVTGIGPEEIRALR